MNTITTLCEASKFFLCCAGESKNLEQKNYYLISSVLCSWMLFESYINRAALTLSKAAKLGAHERAYLLEKELRVDRDGIFQLHNSYPPTTIKALFILNYFSKKTAKKTKQTTLWRNIKECEDIRDSFVHPKGEEIKSISLSKATLVREMVISFIKYLNLAVFKKKLNIY